MQRSHAVDRITLRQLLLSDLDDTVHFGKTFTHYEQHEDKVTAFFDNGSCATGDLCATVTAVRDGQAPLVPALHRYEAELRACGYAAVRTALRTQRQGLQSNHLTVAGSRAWFRACSAVPSLKPLNLPYRAQARPRAWERETVSPSPCQSRSR